MEQLVDSILVRLDSAGFSAAQLALIKDVANEACDFYDITPKTNQIVTYDVLQPDGYKKFMVYKKAQGLSGKTLVQYKLILERFFRTMIKPLDEITSVNIQLYLHELQIAGNQATSVNNHRRVLSSMFTWLFNMQYIARNPMFGVQPIKGKKKAYEPISPEDLEKILGAITNQRDRAIIAVIAGSGIRNGEVCGLLRNRLHLEERKFYVLGKGNKERVCFLTPRAKYELKKYLDSRADDCPYVFTTRRRPHGKIDTHTVGCLFTNLSKKLNMRVYAHKLRHFFADNAHSAGIDTLDISRMLGHESVETTQIYLSEYAEDLQQKHQKLR